MFLQSILQVAVSVGINYATDTFYSNYAGANVCCNYAGLEVLLQLCWWYFLLHLRGWILFFFFAVIKVTVSVGIMQLEVSEHLCR